MQTIYLVFKGIEEELIMALLLVGEDDLDSLWLAVIV